MSSGVSDVSSMGDKVTVSDNVQLCHDADSASSLSINVERLSIADD